MSPPPQISDLHMNAAPYLRKPANWYYDQSPIAGYERRLLSSLVFRPKPHVQPAETGQPSPGGPPHHHPATWTTSGSPVGVIWPFIPACRSAAVRWTWPSGSTPEWCRGRPTEASTRVPITARVAHQLTDICRTSPDGAHVWHRPSVTTFFTGSRAPAPPARPRLRAGCRPSSPWPTTQLRARDESCRTDGAPFPDDSGFGRHPARQGRCASLRDRTSSTLDPRLPTQGRQLSGNGAAVVGTLPGHRWGTRACRHAAFGVTQRATSNPLTSGNTPAAIGPAPWSQFRFNV